VNESYEIVVRDEPFTIRRRVRWSDCDPAGVAFTGRFVDYLIGAVDHFTRHVVGGARSEFVAGLGIDTPCKGLSMDFHVALGPDDTVDIAMRVGRIGEHSWDLEADARLPDGRTAFSGRFTPICIHKDPRRKAAIPAPLRERLERHRGLQS
jgi:acyl-CoA thioesterase FadM